MENDSKDLIYQAKIAGSQFDWQILNGVTIGQRMLAICPVKDYGPALGVVDLEKIVKAYGITESSKYVIGIPYPSVCSSDTHHLEKETSERFAKENQMFGVPLGHEMMVKIVATTPEIDKKMLGRLAAVESHTFIGGKECVLGYRPIGEAIPVAGSFAEFIVLPEENLYLVSDEIVKLLDGKVSLLEPSGNAFFMIWSLMEQLKEKGIEPEGARVIMVGLGGQGRMMMYLAKSQGMEVIGVDHKHEAAKICFEAGIADDKNSILWTKDPQFGDKLSKFKAQAIVDACGDTAVVQDMAQFLPDDGGLMMLFGLRDQEQILPGTDKCPGGPYKLGDFVMGEIKVSGLVIRECNIEVAGKKIKLVGVTGRSKESWALEIAALEKGDKKLAKIILARLNNINSVDELIKLLYPYNGDNQELFKEAFGKGKLVMPEGFSKQLRGTIKGGKPDLEIIQKNLFTDREVKFVPSQEGYMEGYITVG